jgi:hypothetical protein
MRRLGLLLVVFAALGAGCSQATDLTSDAPTTTAPKSATTDPLDQGGDQLNSAGIDQLQRLIDRLLASNDPCAILTQRDVRGNQLDPTIFTSAAARASLAKGVVDVYDHLIQISPVSIRQPLLDQKGVFVQVLGIVNQYADNPNDKGATEKINALLQQQAMVTSQNLLNTYIEQSCP